MILTQLPTFPPQAHDDCIDSKFIFEMIPTDDAISSCTVTAVPYDLLIETVSFFGNEVTCWVSGGTEGVAYVLTVDVTTTGGRTYCRCAVIPVEAPDSNSSLPRSPTAERITTGASPVNASIAVSVTSVTSGGTAGAEHLILPNFALTDPSGSATIAPLQVGTRHTIVLDVQSNPSDSVRVFVGTDGGAAQAIDDAGNLLADVGSAGIVLDYVGAFVSFEWLGASWGLRNESFQNDTVYQTATPVLPPAIGDGVLAFLSTSGTAGAQPGWRAIIAPGSYGTLHTGASPVQAVIQAGASFVITGGTAGTEVVNVLQPQSAFPFAIGARHIIALQTRTNASDVVSIDTTNIRGSDGTTLTSIRLTAANKFVVLESVSLTKWQVIFADATIAPVIAPGSTTTVSTSLTATGTNQGTAFAISSMVNVFTSVAAGTGAILTNVQNVVYTVINRGSNALLIYPPSGAAIEGSATNAAVSVVANGTARFILTSPTKAYAY